jgi:hypothetical protein
MSAGQVAGLLVLLGVVGVLAAIAGSGIEAGPVKFPSIPRTRQKPLAIASAAVIVGGGLWWVIQRQSGTQTQTASNAVQTGPPPTGQLRVHLIPSNSNIRVGDALSVSSEVDNSLGQSLGPGQCVLTWSDAASGGPDTTTQCNATFSEGSVSKAGVHRIVAQAEGTSGLLGKGSNSVEVTVSR